MTWVYHHKLFDTKFQAACLMARLEDAEAASSSKWHYISVFQTPSGRYGVKMLLRGDHGSSSESERCSK